MTEAIPLPESLDPHSLAEWAELVVLIDSIDDLSMTELLAMFPSGQRPPVQDAELCLSIIEDRARIAPSVYPLRRIEDRIVRAGHPDSATSEVDDCIYLFLRVACLQNAPWVQDNRPDLVGSLFDYLVASAMADWMGNGSKCVIFGWPPRQGRPAKLVEAVTWLADLVGLPDGDRDRGPDSKDGGVDCVVWQPPHDQRTGFPIWLVQASVEHGVSAKAAKVIPVESWKRWIKFGAGPTTVFATAHSVPRGSNVWMDLNDAAGVVADRDRILVHLDAAQVATTTPDWYSEVCSFVSAQVEAIRNPPSPTAPRARVRKKKRERSSEYADPRSR